MSKKSFKSKRPGFRYDKTRKIAKFEVCTPGTLGAKRFRKTISVASEDEGYRLFEIFRETVRPGAASTAAPTVKEWFDAHWENRISARLAPITKRNNEWCIRRHILPFFGAMAVDAITDNDVIDFTVKLAKGYQPPTVNFALRRLRELLRDAFGSRKIDRLPAIKLVKETLRQHELSSGEKEAFLNAFDDEAKFMAHIEGSRKRGPVRESSAFTRPRRFGGGRRAGSDAAKADFRRYQRSKSLFMIALETGLRRGDLLNLMWTEVYLDVERPFIRRKMSKTEKVVVVGLSRRAVEALRSCEGDDQEYVFVTEAGLPYDETMFRRYFDKAKKLAGISDEFRPSDCRHTFASTLAAQNVSPLTIRDALGHTSTRTTERYARPGTATIAVVADVLDSLEARQQKPDSTNSLRTCEEILSGDEDKNGEG